MGSRNIVLASRMGLAQLGAAVGVSVPQLNPKVRVTKRWEKPCIFATQNEGSHETMHHSIINWMKLTALGGQQAANESVGEHSCRWAFGCSQVAGKWQRWGWSTQVSDNPTLDDEVLMNQSLPAGWVEFGHELLSCRALIEESPSLHAGVFFVAWMIAPCLDRLTAPISNQPMWHSHFGCILLIGCTRIIIHNIINNRGQSWFGVPNFCQSKVSL